MPLERVVQRGGRESARGGISTPTVNSLVCQCVSENFLFPWRALAPLTEDWQRPHGNYTTLSLCFPCGLTDHKFTTIGPILIPLSVGTRGWLKINNLSFASCSLIFQVSRSFWVYFAVVATVVVLHCSGGGWLWGGGSFFFFFLSSILWRRRNAFLGAVSDTAWSGSFSFII